MERAPSAPAVMPASGSAVFPPTEPLPPVALVPGEQVLRTFRSDRAAMLRVIRRNVGVMMGVMVAVIAPFTLLFMVGGTNLRAALIFVGVMGGILALMAGAMAMGVRRAGRTPPARTTVTDRRILVEHFGKNATPTMMFLENVNRVELNQTSAARKAGAQWVYVLPLGTDKALIQAGKSRQVAPGVLWIPAMSSSDAEAFRDLVNSQSQAVRSRVMGGAANLPPPPAPPPI